MSIYQLRINNNMRCVYTYIHTYIYSLTTIHACMSCGVVVHVLVIMLPLQQMKKKFEAGDLTTKDLELVIHVNYIIVLGAH